MITSPDRLANHDRTQIHGGQILEDAAERANRRPAGAENHCVGVFRHD
jgi:hypothetical protein